MAQNIVWGTLWKGSRGNIVWGTVLVGLGVYVLSGLIYMTAVGDIQFSLSSSSASKGEASKTKADSDSLGGAATFFSPVRAVVTTVWSWKK